MPCREKAQCRVVEMAQCRAVLLVQVHAALYDGRRLGQGAAGV